MQKHSQMKFPKGIDCSQSQTGSRRFVWSNCPKIFVFEKGVSLHLRHYSINSTSQPVKNNETDEKSGRYLQRKFVFEEKSLSTSNRKCKQELH